MEAVEDFFSAFFSRFFGGLGPIFTVGFVIALLWWLAKPSTKPPSGE